MQPDISVVIPVYNQDGVLRELQRRLVNTLTGLHLSYEIIFVDDYSSNSTKVILKEIVNLDPCVLCIELQRNCGQSNAIAAGLQYTGGSYIVVMDADLQDKPEDIVLLYTEIADAGTDLVLASRPSSNGTLFRRLSSMAFYRMSNLLTTLRQPPNTGVFRIFRLELLQKVLAQAPQPGTILSRIQLAARKTLTVQTSRDLTNKSTSGYTFLKLFRLAAERFIVYPRYPLPYLHSYKALKRYIPRYSIAKVLQADRND